jgi:hypothetical protein
MLQHRPPNTSAAIVRSYVHPFDLTVVQTEELYSRAPRWFAVYPCDEERDALPNKPLDAEGVTALAGIRFLGQHSVQLGEEE